MSIDVASQVLSVNLARVRLNPHKRGEALTGMDKVPTSKPVLVRAPGTKREGLGGGAGWRYGLRPPKPRG